MAGKDVLSEGELEALMESVSSTDAIASNGETRVNLRLFDFSAREQNQLEQLPVLLTLHEKLAATLTPSLQGLFRAPVEVVPADLKMVKLEEVLLSIPELAGINLVNATPLSGLALAVLPGDSLSFFVNQYFGGQPGSAAFKSARSHLTPTEKRINDLMIGRFLSALSESWKDVLKLSPEVVKFETNPDFLQLGTSSSLFLKGVYQLSLFDWKGTLEWAMPYNAIESIKARLEGTKEPEGGSEVDTSGWSHHFRKELMSIDVSVSGQIGCRTMSLAEILNLRQGSIVSLSSPTDVTLYVEDEAFCTGEYGAISGKKSIKIRGLVNDDSRS
ncbi:flagellar motor switch protein FliM [Porticoccus sp.]